MDRINKYKNLGAKRLMLEAQELKDNTEDYWAQPIEDNLFEWHFTVRGPPDTVFDGGYYHGRISFPTDYPMKPPSIILLTPNGRFETNKKICLSISGYHPETWQPSWSIRTALLALIAFMPTKANGAIGSLDLPGVERKRLAKKSHTWKCEKCGLIKDLLVQPNPIRSINPAETSDNIPTASTSDSAQSVIQNGLENGSIATHRKIHANGTSNIKSVENKSECSESSTNGRVSREINTNNNMESECTNSQTNLNNSPPVAEAANHRQTGNESILANVDQGRDQSRVDAPREQFNCQIIPQTIPNQRSYSIIIFGMAAVLVLLILRRLFFVVL